MSRKTLRRALVGLVGAYALFSLIAGISLAEFSLKLGHKKITDGNRTVVYERVAAHRAHLNEVGIRSHDGLMLRGWFVRPERPNGNAVVLLHGVADNRLGVAGYGEFLLMQGYDILMPDARDHGESEGGLASYGVREAEDVHQWVDWIYGEQKPQCVFGFGESMGAAIILQSLKYEKRFCGVVAESSFADFREGAYDRVSEYTGSKTTFAARTLLRPAIEIGVAYARVRYGLDLLQASPRRAVEQSNTPVLLIHGKADVNIRPQNSEMIYRDSKGNVELWEVAGAAHCGAWSRDPKEFKMRLLNFFNAHSRSLYLRG